jgi:hypothetical protein
VSVNFFYDNTHSRGPVGSTVTGEYRLGVISLHRAESNRV